MKKGLGGRLVSPGMCMERAQSPGGGEAAVRLLMAQGCFSSHQSGSKAQHLPAGSSNSGPVSAHLLKACCTAAFG